MYGAPDRLDPGHDPTPAASVDFPAEALKPKKLKEIRLDLTYLRSPYKQVTLNLAVSIGGQRGGCAQRGDERRPAAWHQMAFRSVAEIFPFWPFSSSNETFWFSLSVPRPARSTAEMCTNTSFDWSSG